MSRPEPAEYDPYYERYISLVPEEDVVNVLAHQSTELARMFHGVSDSVGTFAYEEGKWTAKEVLSHLIDGERMFAYRVFRIARGDQTPIEGFEQDGYIENSHANRRSISDLLDEFKLLRKTNIMFFRNLEANDWTRIGTANNVEISVRSLAWIMAGHIRHHAAILKERYFAKS